MTQLFQFPFGSKIPENILRRIQRKILRIEDILAIMKVDSGFHIFRD